MLYGLALSRFDIKVSAPPTRKFKGCRLCRRAPLTRRLDDWIGRAWSLDTFGRFWPAAWPAVQQNIVSVQQNMVPVQQNMVPVQQNMVPVQQNMVPVQQNMVPVQQNMVPLQQNMVPLQQNMVPVQQNMVPVQQKEM